MLNPEYLAVRHILTAPQIAERTAPYILDEDFDFDGLEAERSNMSGGEALLVRVASDLWHANRAVGLYELPRRLDASNFRRVVDALTIARDRGALPELTLLAERLAA